MVIWVLDCASCYCTKVSLSEEKEKELENVFDDDVEDFLARYEDELGISVKHSSWMITNEGFYDEKKL